MRRRTPSSQETMSSTNHFVLRFPLCATEHTPTGKYFSSLSARFRSPWHPRLLPVILVFSMSASTIRLPLSPYAHTVTRSAVSRPHPEYKSTRPLHVARSWTTRLISQASLTYQGATAPMSKPGQQRYKLVGRAFLLPNVI